MRKTPAPAIFTCLFIIITTLPGCWSFYKYEEGQGSATNYLREVAYVPIYGIDTAYRTIYSMPPQPIVKSGKIYVFGAYLFQVENGRGVHIIDYGNKSNPVKVGFISSGGASEIAVKGGYLIVNNAADLVTVDISNLPDIKEVARVKNAFRTFNSQQYTNARPPGKGYFVCPYSTASPDGPDVIGWKLEHKVPNAYCQNY